MTVVADDPEDQKGRLKQLGGSQSDRWNNTLANQAAQSLWRNNSSPEERDKQVSATIAALFGIAPKDELEGMVAAQLIAAHNAAMECYRRGFAWSSPALVWWRAACRPDIRRCYLNRASLFQILSNRRRSWENARDTIRTVAM